MTSRDVIHSFWVPEFRVKQDVLPGREPGRKSCASPPTRPANYKVMCAELCGGAHAYMKAPVMVVSQAEFETWLASR